MVTIYGTHYSGNCYKLFLLCHQLNIPFQWREIDILKKQSRTPEFLAKNLVGKVPVLELEDGRHLPESNAALFYLAEHSSLLPEGRFPKAQVLQWMFFEQFSHEPFIASSRFIISYLKTAEENAELLKQKKEPGYRALQVMEDHLQHHPWFVGEHYSIADIALFAYTHVAEEGDFDLQQFPNILRWLDQVKASEHFVPMSSIEKNYL